ncbi:MAG: ATP synthase F1 subunit delta [Isosphaeraceae bacterium]|nr:ATP synthase F1 subunit delta [Isosphaeraceae bacterium]
MSTSPQTRDNAEAFIPGTVFDEGTAEVARSYAEALLNAASRDGQAEAVLGELEELREDLLRPFPRFAELLASPSLPAQDKDRMLVETLEGRAHPLVLRFLRVLNRHGRLALLDPILRRARELWDRRQNRIPVEVRSAVPLDEAQQAALRERLAQMTGAHPVIHLTVDPSLLGGLVVQVGDRLYDVSVRTRLEQLRHRLVEEKARDLREHREVFSV